MMDRLFDTILGLADATIERLVPEELPWMWGEALLMHSLGQLNELLGEDKYTPYIKRYVDYHIAKGIKINQSDKLAPTLATYYLQKKYPHMDYDKITDLGLLYIKDSKKIIDNMPNHLGFSPEGRLYPKSIWVDSIMMYGVFTSIYAKEQNIKWLMDFAKSQPALFKKYLQDDIDKLFVHSYWVNSHKKYPPKLYWGRGNGWVVASMPMLIDNLDDGFEKDICVEILLEVSEALLKYQRNDGYFETLLNRQGETPKESSATALIASGWLHGIRCNYIDESYKEPAIKALEAVVNDLIYRNNMLSMDYISGPTIPMPLIPKLGYKLQYKFQKSADWSYGLAALIFAGIQYKKLMQ